MSPDKASEIRQVLHPVTDVARAADFYGEIFGFTPKFTDGDRFAALDAGAVTLALVGGTEDVTHGAPAAAIKVADLAAAVQAVVDVGGKVVRGLEHGPHEGRAVVHDPWDNPIVLYQSRGSSSGGPP